MFALLICSTLACADFQSQTDFIYSREACLAEMRDALALEAAPRAMCATDGFGEIIDSRGKIARGWQHGVSPAEGNRMDMLGMPGGE